MISELTRGGFFIRQVDRKTKKRREGRPAEGRLREVGRRKGSGAAPAAPQRAKNDPRAALPIGRALVQ